MLAIGFIIYANAVHSRDLLLVFSASLVLQNPKFSFPLEGGGGCL
jgi:hypothetical protein